MTASCSQSQYRVRNGLSSPSLISSWWISDGVAWAPSSSWAASPGSEFITTNETNVTPSSTGIAISRRRTMNRSVGEPASRPARPARAASGALSGAEALLIGRYPCPTDHYCVYETSCHNGAVFTTTDGIDVVSPGPCTPCTATFQLASGNRKGPSAFFAMYCAACW